MTNVKASKLSWDGLVAEYISHIRLRRLSEKTVTIYEGTLRRFTEHIARGQTDVHIKLGDITPAVAASWVVARSGQKTKYVGHDYHPLVEQGLSPFTLFQEANTMRVFGAWLEKQEYPNPFKGLPRPKMPKRLVTVLTVGEIEELFRAFNPKTAVGARWQAILAFFLDTGVRVSELSSLKLADLDMRNGRAKVTGKGDKDRYVYFGDLTVKHLSRYLNLHRPESDNEHVFMALDGSSHLTLNGVEGILKRVRKNSGIARVHCHLFRHTFATNYLIAGGNSFELKDLLGHESLEMTDKYQHVADAMRAGATPRSKRISVLESMRQ